MNRIKLILFLTIKISKLYVSLSLQENQFVYSNEKLLLEKKLEEKKT